MNRDARRHEGMLADAAHIIDHALVKILDREPVDEITSLGTGALADIDMLIENPPEGVDVDKLAALRRRLAEQAERGSR